jgi:Domain of unknown function (DUF4470)
MLYPVDASARTDFSPIRFEPSTSFIQDIPPGKNVNCLLLGCGDPRNILFTLFGDEGSTGITLPSLSLMEQNPRVILTSLAAM